jgi:hypothetical protein
LDFTSIVLVGLICAKSFEIGFRLWGWGVR